VLRAQRIFIECLNCDLCRMSNYFEQEARGTQNNITGSDKEFLCRWAQANCPLKLCVLILSLCRFKAIYKVVSELFFVYIAKEPLYLSQRLGGTI
jgi:hypothetical protein